MKALAKPENLSEFEGDALIERVTQAILAYGELVYGYVPAPHHRRIIRFAVEGLIARKHTQILAPRGAAKSTWSNTTLLAWLLSMFDLRVGLISNTTDPQAIDFSRAIKNTYEISPEHRDLFGDLVNASKWTHREWVKKGSKFAAGSKDVSCFAVGVGGSIVSKRFDVLLMDDILDEENTATPEARENTRTWFLKTLKPCLAPDGVVISIGTRWSEDDLYEHFITPVADGGQGWRHLIIPALTEDPETHQLVSYWQQYWPVERLLEEKESLGSPLFSCAYQNDISGLLEGNIFRGPFDHFKTLPEGHRYTTKMGVDLASSTKERADYTSRVTVAQDICQHECGSRGMFYVLSAYRDRRESHHADFVKDGFDAYPEIGLVIVESQQFQSTLVQEVMETYPQIPIEGKKADTDKTTRARAVAAKYEGHKVLHHISLRGTAFETELLSFPKGHDDLIDALGYAMDLGGGGLIFGSVNRATGGVTIRT